MGPPLAVGKPRSIRSLALAWSTLFGVLAVGLAVLLVWATSRINEATTTIVRDTESLQLSDEIELRLLTYNRISNLLATSRQPELATVQASLASDMRRLLNRARGYSSGAGEDRHLVEVSREIERYLDQREALEARRLPLQDLVREVAPILDRALEEVESLRDLNRSQVQRAHAAAARLDAWSNLLGISSAVVLLVGIFGLLVGLWRYVLRPLRSIEDSMLEFREGDTEARAVEAGGRETARIARAFNELAGALGRQRQNQLAFLAGVAHDLRNPLSALKMGMRTLVPERTAGPEKAGATLSLIDRQIDRLTRMVTDLLDATRIEAGSLQLSLVDMDLRKAAREVVDLYAPTSPAHQVILEEPDQPVRLKADPLRIEQVVSNLVSNAIKYSPGGGPIQVVVGCTETEALLVVQDHGLGIPREETADIFMPFRRRAATQDVAPGAGLGLAVVRRIVVAHGGRIEVESRPGSGSTFRVLLPLEGVAPASR